MVPRLVWLITGCSSGFGDEIVRQVLDRGDLVIATSRKLDSLKQLEELPHENLSIFALDVTDSQELISNTIGKALEIHGRIDVLVNNAGYIAVGSWEDLSYEDLTRQFETNVFGVFKVTRALLLHMRARQTGTLVFIGSRSGWYGDAFCGAYSGSKFALEGMVESLSRETEKFGISTLLIDPGRFRTGFLSTGKGKLAAVESRTKDYELDYTRLLQILAVEDGNQPGDVKKGVKVIVDLVRKEKIAEGRDKIPLRLPIGADCVETIREKCLETLGVLKDWESVITGCDHA